MDNEERHSSVNWRKILENYRGNYNYNEEWEITVIELIANAIDAGASKVKLSYTRNIGKVNLICEDDGEGMDKEKFIEYHNLGSLTKDKTTGMIGFAGIGAKLCIDLCEVIYTETCNGDKTIASEWWFKKNEMEPHYKIVKPRKSLQYKSGTYVEIKNLIAPSLEYQAMRSLILDNYEYILRPYGKLSIIINDIELSQEKPAEAAYKFEKTIPISKKPEKNLHIFGEFFFVDDEWIQDIKKIRGEYISGINIVVGGKTVLKGQFFNLLSNIKPGDSGYITGYIRCDELIEVIKTSKDGFNTKNSIWWNFETNSKQIVEKWLKEIGEWYEPSDRGESDFTDIIVEIEKNLNRIINNFPELIKDLPFSSKIKKPTPIKDANGYQVGAKTDTGQLTTGTYGGETPGSEEKLPTLGPDEEIQGVGLDENGDIKVKTPQKRVQGPKLTIVKDEGRKDVIWFDPSIGAFVINEAHPAFIVASRKTEALDIYVTYILFNYIIELQNEFDEDKRKDYLWNLFKTYSNQLK
ncbi:MAG: ATP-binding protein [Candidatus Micrarchaeia archaeon]